jgi:hypothetical protein
MSCGKNVKYEQDEQCFTLFTERSPEIVTGLKTFGVPVSQTIAVVFPKTHGFIREIKPDRLGRLKKHGLDIEKLLVLEIPYVVTYSTILDPAMAQVNFVVPKGRRVYLRSLTFTDGYVSNCHAIELEDTIMHESIHLKEHDEALREGAAIYEREDLDAMEGRVESLVKQKLGAKYGRALGGVELQSGVYALDEQSRRKTLISGYLGYWLHSFVSANYGLYENRAIVMPPEMEGGNYLELMDKEFEDVRQKYKALFKFDLPEVSK